MHVIRAHRPTWSTLKKKSAAKRTARNATYIKYRNRYRAMGLNAKGQPYKRPPQDLVNGAVAPARKAMGRPRETNKTCPVCKKTFAARPNMTLHLRKVHRRSIQEFGGAIRGKWQRSTPAPTESPRPMPAAKAAKREGREVIFCPVCGTNIHAVRTAVNFAEQ